MSDQDLRLFILFMFGVCSTGLCYWSLKYIKTAWMLPSLTFVCGWAWAFFLAAMIDSTLNAAWL